MKGHWKCFTAGSVPVDAGEIKRMYVWPKFRGGRLDDLLIGEVLVYQKGMGSQNFIWIQYISCLQQYPYTINLDLRNQVLIQEVLSQKDC